MLFLQNLNLQSVVFCVPIYIIQPNSAGSGDLNKSLGEGQRLTKVGAAKPIAHLYGIKQQSVALSETQWLPWVT